MHSELLSLLNALCEERISREGMMRLEQIVIASREARRLYVRYLNVHGTLGWNASQPDSSAAIPRSVPPGIAAEMGAVPRKSRAERWSVARVGSLAGIAAAVLFVAILWLTQNASTKVVAVAPSSTATPEASALVARPPVAQQKLAARDAFARREDVPSPVPESPQLSPDQSLTVDATTSLPHPATGEPAVIPPAPISDFEIVSRINGLIEQKWDEAGVQPVEAADDAEWLRRVYLDLVGHIPDRETLGQFLEDRRSNKRRLIVESLLQSPDYARNWSTVWLNLLVGRSSDRPINREALAKFLRHQFHENRPWTETVSRLIAAEGDENEVGEANFLLAHLNNQAVPATAVTTRIFLCRQVQCTQCHKHPDSKHGGSMAEFWELNSFFQQASIVENTKYNPETGRTEVVSRSLVDRPVGGPTFYDDLGGLMRVAYPKFAGQEVEQEPTIKRRQELARLITTSDQAELAAALVNRTWNHFFGRGLVNPIDDMGPHTPSAHPELLKALTDAVVASHFDIQRLNRWIVMSRPYQLSSSGPPDSEHQVELVTDDDFPVFNKMNLKSLSPEQVFESLIVATAADRGGNNAWEQADAQRQLWMKQFFTSMENEENCDASRFDGTYSQAMMMMNGDLVQKAVSNQPGTVLNEILRSSDDDQEKIRQLCRAALGRDPKRTEMASFQAILKRRNDARKNSPGTFEDIFWAYLNSTEFSVNH